MLPTVAVDKPKKNVNKKSINKNYQLYSPSLLKNGSNKNRCLIKLLTKNEKILKKKSTALKSEEKVINNVNKIVDKKHRKVFYRMHKSKRKKGCGKLVKKIVNKARNL